MRKALRINVWNKYKKHCAYCGAKLEYKNMQVDHIHPKYLGGANNINNYNPSCRGCNFYKSTYTIEEFREKLYNLSKVLSKISAVKTALRYGILKHKGFNGKFYFERKFK